MPATYLCVFVLKNSLKSLGIHRKSFQIEKKTDSVNWFVGIANGLKGNLNGVTSKKRIWIKNEKGMQKKKMLFRAQLA